MKNKALKIILINIFSILSIFFVFDFVYMTKSINGLRADYSVVNNAFQKPNDYIKYYIKRYFVYIRRFINYDKILDNAYVYDIEHRYRRVENIDSEKKSILIFGCSYAHGDNLQENETFSYNLGKLTGQPVYNRAFSGRAPQYMLYQLQNQDFYKNIKTEPEFIIYVYYFDQFIRLFVPCHYFNSGGIYSEPSVFFNKKQGELLPDKFPSITSASPLVIKIKRNLYYKIMHQPKNHQKAAEILFDYLKKSKDIILRKYPNSKFIIVQYNPDIIMNIAEPKLQEEGFYIFHINQDLIFQPEFCLKDGHPSAYAWEYFTPQIVDFMNQIRAGEI